MNTAKHAQACTEQGADSPEQTRASTLSHVLNLTHAYTVTGLLQSATSKMNQRSQSNVCPTTSLNGRSRSILGILTQACSEEAQEDPTWSVYGPLCEATQAVLDDKTASSVVIFQVQCVCMRIHAHCVFKHTFVAMRDINVLYELLLSEVCFTEIHRHTTKINTLCLPSGYT